jgi:hypothetical protein
MPVITKFAETFNRELENLALNFIRFSIWEKLGNPFWIFFHPAEAAKLYVSFDKAVDTLCGDYNEAADEYEILKAKKDFKKAQSI